MALGPCAASFTAPWRSLTRYLNVPPGAAVEGEGSPLDDLPATKRPSAPRCLIPSTGSGRWVDLAAKLTARQTRILTGPAERLETVSCSERSRS